MNILNIRDFKYSDIVFNDKDFSLGPIAALDGCLYGIRKKHDGESVHICTYAHLTRAIVRQLELPATKYKRNKSVILDKRKQLCLDFVSQLEEDEILCCITQFDNWLPLDERYDGRPFLGASSLDYIVNYSNIKKLFTVSRSKLYKILTAQERALETALIDFAYEVRNYVNDIDHCNTPSEAEERAKNRALLNLSRRVQMTLIEDREVY